MKVLLVQPSRLQPDGSVYKNKTRWLLGMTLPYLAALDAAGDRRGDQGRPLRGRSTSTSRATSSA